MRKRYIASAIGATGAGIAGYLLRNENNRSKLKQRAKYYSDKVRSKNSSDHTLEEAGIPDQMSEYDTEQFENSKMVSEGSQFGVEYYNEVKNNKKENM
ncbi:hypothetical protein ACFO3D_01980 [Virgibacillus kekensis]|uniref:YtxH domain-containing protein n=1 Tax=Virgibacillus kekensis TaxID=202261 RepID=A0ABV9DE40_9BACI